MTPPQTMIERVARALCENAATRGLDADWTNHLGGGTTTQRVAAYVERAWPKHEADARAALGAMAEPTEAMISAAARAAWHSGSGQDPANICRAVISAALTDGSQT